ncbi:MAG: flavodoxin family protein [Candidatus Methanospirareceae archaeon]
MVKVLVIYHSRTGNTERMAKEVVEGAKEEGAETRLKNVKDVEMEDLKWADGIIIGSPTYFGLPAYEIKELIDKSVKIRGELENKVGAAFSSSAHRAGGRETTMLSILHAMLIHGMVVCGDPLYSGGHYGAAADGQPDDEALKECRALGKRVASLAKKIKG